MSANWFVLHSATLRVRTDGNKKGNDKTIDLSDPEKSIQELETKTGLTCPENRKKELLEQLKPKQKPTFELPEWYKTASKEDVTLAFEMGQKYVEKQKNMMTDDLANIVINEKMSVVKEEYEKVITTLQSTIKELNDTLMKNEKKSSQVFEQAKVMARDLLVQQYEKQLTDTQLQLKSTQERLDGVLEQRSMMNKTGVKGSVGEDIVGQWLRHSFVDTTITHVAGQTGKMDYCLKWKDMVVAIDVKHHEGKELYKKDVDKFHRDMESNPDYVIGILLCTRSTIPNSKNWIEVRMLNDTQVAVYMSDVAENPVERLQMVIGSVIEPFREFQAMRDNLLARYSGDELEEWKQQASDILAKGWTDILTLQTHWSKMFETMKTSMKEHDKIVARFVEDFTQDIAKLKVSAKQPMMDVRKERKKPGPKPKQ